MTTIPLVASPADTTGLTFTKVDYGQGGLWYARYTKDGTRRRKSLRTPDMQVALKARDKFYAELVAAGATVADAKAGRKWSPLAQEIRQIGPGGAMSTVDGKYFRRISSIVHRLNLGRAAGEAKWHVRMKTGKLTIRRDLTA